jgi:hypothetical protein
MRWTKTGKSWEGGEGLNPSTRIGSRALMEPFGSDAFANHQSRPTREYSGAFPSIPFQSL